MSDGGLTRNPERAPRMETPEAGIEVTREMPEAGARAEAGVGEAAAVGPIATVLEAAPRPAPVVKDPVLQRVEKILEEDLNETYRALPPELQPKFKQKGEQTAAAIRQLLTQAKIQTKKILRLIVGWLRLIPHVNRFFLEQEAKIKTDEIMKLAEEGRSKSAESE